MRRALGAVLLLLVTAPLPSGAQVQPATHDEASVMPALRSLVVPGWGQLAMGQDRGWAYLAAEAVAWTLHLRWRSEGRDLRRDYRDLAWSVALGGVGAPRSDPGFAYFEHLARWPTSGRWDTAPEMPGVQPEQDPSTFNGMVWARARDLFLGGGAPEPSRPGYGAALAYYEERAYGPELLWDWIGKEGDLERYRDLIDESDGSLRRATHALGAVLANHVFSGVDAWISSRSDARVHARVAPTAGPFGPGWTWTVAVTP